MTTRDWDEETNDGKGWAAHERTCPYCGRFAVHVAPADIPPEQLECGHCGLREQEPPPPN